jgi:two-component sensor histidine kinase
MPNPVVRAHPPGLVLAQLFAWPRVRFTLLFSFAIGALLGLGWKSGWSSAVVRVVGLGLVLMVVFGVFEQWPRRLPKWLARWILQVVAVAVAVPFATAWIYYLSTPDGAPAFFHDMDRMKGFSALTGLGIFLSPWVALGALVRQKDALARHQALAFDLERSELERRALDARLNLLQAQVAPHFLFNTLANVQALVDAGSPQASAVLRSLIAYLRAAVPRLHEPATTLGQELDLVRAYLELMHMRMPDRLQFALHVDEAARMQHCPPMTLLTLVENAVRHGIDPSEEGGRIDVYVQRRGDRCLVRVSDTGVGLQRTGNGLGTGLSTLRERLALVFGGDAELRVVAQHPRGVSAEIDLPARGAPA